MKKLPIIIISVIFLLTAIIGTVIILSTGKEEENLLSVQYIGGDKFIGQNVTSKDFTVVYLPTNSKLTPEQFTVENTELFINGTEVCIFYTTPQGEMIDTKVVVYPTLTITEIQANLINTNRFIGSTLINEDFEVKAIDNKGNSYNITNFTITPNVIEAKDSDIEISYIYNNTAYKSIVHITTCENYFTEIKAEFIGENNFIGQTLTPEDFLVTATFADGEVKPITGFKIANPKLTSEKSVITIGAQNSKKEVVVTEVEVEGRNYIKSIYSILYVGDEQTVGNTLDISDFDIQGYKSDGQIVPLTNCKISKGEKLTTTSNNVTITYYNEIGQLLEGKAVVRADDNIIFIGDCRNMGLEASLKDTKDIIYFISNEVADYNWLNEFGVNEAQAIMDKNVFTKYRVVINLGLFDSENVELYANLLKTLAQDKWKNHQIYIVSLNPIDEITMDEAGIYSREIINTSKIKDFNNKMEELISTDIANLTFLNVNGSIINQGFKTIDGINYNKKTYSFYYTLIKSLTY